MAAAGWWVLSVLLILVGLAGTVLPALPGTVLVLAGIVLGAWIDDFTRVSQGTLAVVAALAVLAWGLDYVAGLLGARRAGASPQALVGAALGTVAGLFMGLVGVLFMPFVGAVAGEYIAPPRRARRRDGGCGHLAGHHGRAAGQGGAEPGDGGRVRRRAAVLNQAPASRPSHSRRA